MLSVGPKSPFRIHSFPDEGDEVMHGVGLRLSSHGVEGGNTNPTIDFILSTD